MLVALLTPHTTLPDHLSEDDFAYCGGSTGHTHWIPPEAGLLDSHFRLNLQRSEEDELWFAPVTTPCGWFGLS